MRIETNNIMKKYIATFTDTKGADWDEVIVAESYKDALREARAMQKEMGKLFSVRWERKPALYVVVAGDVVVSPAYFNRGQAVADPSRGESIIEVLPTDDGYDELLTYC